MKGKLITTALGVGALLMATGMAQAINLDNCSFPQATPLTVDNCVSGICTVKGTLSCVGESLNDSACAVGGNISEPVEGKNIIGSLALTNYRLQNPTTCPDAKLLAQYNGAAQSFAIAGTWIELQNNGNYVWEGSFVSQSGGLANGNIENFIAVQWDYNPDVADAFYSQTFTVVTSFE